MYKIVRTYFTQKARQDIVIHVIYKILKKILKTELENSKQHRCAGMSLEGTSTNVYTMVQIHLLLNQKKNHCLGFFSVYMSESKKYTGGLGKKKVQARGELWEGGRKLTYMRPRCSPILSLGAHAKERGLVVF